MLFLDLQDFKSFSSSSFSILSSTLYFLSSDLLDSTLLLLFSKEYLLSIFFSVSLVMIPGVYSFSCLMFCSFYCFELFYLIDEFNFFNEVKLIFDFCEYPASSLSEDSFYILFY